MCSEVVGFHQVELKEENPVSFPSHTGDLTPRLEGSSAECLLPMKKTTALPVKRES